MIIQLIFSIITGIITGSGNADSTIFFALLFILYPIVDIIKNRFFNEERYAILLPVAVPLGLSVIITLVAIVIGKLDAVNLFFGSTQSVGIVIFVVYLLAMPAVSMIKQNKPANDAGSAAVPEFFQSEK